MVLFVVLQICILAALSIHHTNGENIAVFAFPRFSQVKPLVKTAEELANLGHTSYILIPETYRNKLNPIADGVKFIIVDEFQEWLELTDIAIKFYTQNSKMPTSELSSAITRVCDYYLFNDKLLQTLKSLNISLVLINGDNFDICLTIFAYKLNVPFVFLGLDMPWYWHRTPWLPTIFPERVFPFSDRMTLSQKMENLYFFVYDYIYQIGTPNRRVKEYVPENPVIEFEDLVKQCELFIIDSDVFLNFPRPTLPNVKYIGGLATGPAVPLQGKLLDFMDTSEHGVIIVSSGSYLNWTSDHLNKMSEAFSKIKYDVVWKQSNSSYSRQNVLLDKWLPQNDVLAHRNTKLFITHCGNSGQYEALSHAVPMIGLPTCGDQYFNGHVMQTKGYGIIMDLYKFTTDELVKNIEEVIENPKYKKTIAKASHMFRSQKERPPEKAARHIDEIIKYGGSHLRSACQDIPLYEFFMLDILIVILSAVFISFCIIVFVVRKCSRYFCVKCKSKLE